MGEIRLQVGCLVIMFYIIIMYVKESKSKDIECNKYYDAILIVAPLAVVFDGITAWTVNHMAVVPNLINVTAHLIYFVLMDVLLIISAIYMYETIAGVDEHKKVRNALFMLGTVSVALIMVGIGSIRFIEGTHTNYSLGFSAYVCFASVAVFYGFILMLIVMLRKNLPLEKRLGASSFIVIIGILLALQLIFPEFLIASLCPTIMVIGMYIVFENPALRKVEIHKEKVIDSFATLLENRDDNTGGHIKRTKQYVQLLLKKMETDEHYIDVMTKDYVAYVTEAAPLHDIGKISTPDAILCKPGKLTNEEFEIMKQHAADGGDIIINTFKDIYSAQTKRVICEVARHHHEKYNGKGYPDGLVGEDIPLPARIMAIADVFDAVSQNRCYRGAMPLDECFAIIENGAGTDFDPLLVKLFMDAKEEVIQLYKNNTN